MVSIYKTKTNQNFGIIVGGLCYFDAITSGTYGGSITDKQVSLLRGLIALELSNDKITDNDESKKSDEWSFGSFLNGLTNKKDNDQSNNNSMISFDPYIISTFRSFLKTKQDIVIDYLGLESEESNIIELIMYKFKEKRGFNVRLNDNGKRNLFKPELLQLFSNIKSITLLTNSGTYGEGHRPLSMNLLLSMIQNVLSLQKVVVLSRGDPDDQYWDGSWQTYIWKKSSSELIKRFEQSNYKIQLKYKIGSKKCSHGFVITRIL